MPSVDVVDLNNAVVGSLDLADEVFDAPVNEDLLYEAVRHSRAGQRGGNAKTKSRTKYPVRQEAVAAKRHWSAPAWAPYGRLCGGMAAPLTARNPAITATNFRARCYWALCGPPSPRNCATAN